MGPAEGVNKYIRGSLGGFVEMAAKLVKFYMVEELGSELQESWRMEPWSDLGGSNLHELFPKDVRLVKKRDRIKQMMDQLAEFMEQLSTLRMASIATPKNMRRRVLNEYFPRLADLAAAADAGEDDKAEALAVKDREGKQPLHWAAHRGHKRMVKELLKLRASPGAKDRNGARPVHLAAFEGKTRALRELLEVESRRSATARTDGGAEPLHLAATRGHAEVAKLLLRRKASPDARDAKGAQPLHMAAYEGHAAMVDLLLASGAPPDAGADDGTDPAKLAWTRGHKDDLAQKLNDAIPKRSPGGRKVLGPLHEDL
ncbi:unnamed protein product [Effrenium voratum]|nr:unnamed protein product [Effrenium voratum]